MCQQKQKMFYKKIRNGGEFFFYVQMGVAYISLIGNMQGTIYVNTVWMGLMVHELAKT